MSRYEYEPLRHAMLTAIPQARALRGGVLLHRKQSGVHSAQVVEGQHEENEEVHVLEANEASDDELKAEYKDEKQHRTEVNRARQFFRKPQSSADRKTRLDKLKQKLPCARCGQLGHWKDDNECLAKVKVVHWEKTEEQATEEPHQCPPITFLSYGRTVCNHSGVIDTVRPHRELGGLRSSKWS